MPKNRCARTYWPAAHRRHTQAANLLGSILVGTSRQRYTMCRATGRPPQARVKARKTIYSTHHSQIIPAGVMNGWIVPATPRRASCSHSPISKKTLLSGKVRKNAERFPSPTARNNAKGYLPPVRILGHKQIFKAAVPDRRGCEPCADGKGASIYPRLSDPDLSSRQNFFFD